MGGVFILGQGTQNSHVLLERFEESRLVPAFFYLAAVGVVLATALDTGFSHRGWRALQLILMVLISIPAAFLLIASLIGLASYFIFLPSISQDSHLFLRAHARHLIHPLKTSIVLGLAVLCVFTRSQAGWAIWIVLPMIHAFQTFLIIRRARREHPISEPTGSGDGTLQLLLNLILGTEIVTAASGVKGLPPWRLDTMSEDTWMIDVRTKAEFHWNRLRGAENYPWGKGIIEAAQGKSKERPVLIICLTGHRSPSVAVTLRKLGFKSVYHLTWGLVYLLLLERDGKREGPFSFEKSHGNPSKRDEELKGISIGYLTLAAVMFIAAPLENIWRQVHLSGVQKTFGAMIGLIGLMLVVLSYRALGKNFRVFAAPRRNGKLITSGLYSKVRHPMYTGAILMMGGWVLFFGSLWSAPLWLAFSILYLVKSVKEERILNDRFSEYGEYRKITWAFLPYIY
jgi:protein-S-isoprenylcysteine O-methyltransferase Ste14